MEPGEGISGQHTLPIGQVFFVPREDIVARDCTKEEIEQLKASRQEFLHHKSGDRLTTPYGYTYSPHYLKKSRESREATKDTKTD